jgi:hypothetical protein
MDLIKAAKSAKAKRAMPAPLLKELRSIVEHNDVAPPYQRVSINDAMKMLTDGGFPCASGSTMGKICREQLGRTSWSKK